MTLLIPGRRTWKRFKILARDRALARPNQVERQACLLACLELDGKNVVGDPKKTSKATQAGARFAPRQHWAEPSAETLRLQ